MITGVILAGGQASRMGHCQKALQHYQQRPLLDHVYERFSPQVDQLLLNVQSAHAQAYQGWDVPLVYDHYTDFPGPLAGIHAALRYSEHLWLAVVPCDTPHLPTDLVQRLHSHIADDTQVVVAETSSGLESVCLLVHKSALPSLESYLNQGKSKVEHWFNELKTKRCFFQEADRFRNYNRLNDLL